MNKADLADVFQEVFLAVSRNIAAFERETGVAKFRAWLKTITLSKVHDHFRRQGKQPQALGGSTAQFRLGEIEAAQPPSDDEDADEALVHSEDVFLAQRTLQMVKKEFSEPLRSASLKPAQWRLVPLGLVPLRLVSLRLVSLGLASVKLAPNSFEATQMLFYGPSSCPQLSRR